MIISLEYFNTTVAEFCTKISTTTLITLPLMNSKNSDYYELDRLPSIQASAVIQATKQHFGRHGVPHTLITDNGAQFTSEAFKTFAEKYKFHHIT